MDVYVKFKQLSEFDTNIVKIMTHQKTNNYICVEHSYRIITFIILEQLIVYLIKHMATECFIHDTFLSFWNFISYSLT